jgi:hypothetical protein
MCKPSVELHLGVDKPGRLMAVIVTNGLIQKEFKPLVLWDSIAVKN